MTIQAAPSEKSYAGDGVSTVFAIPFPFDTSADLKLTSTDSAGNIATLSTGFTISGGAGSTGNATFTVAPATGVTITIYDNPALTQPTNYVSLDAFPAESHEKALDRVTRIAKRLYQLVQRSVRFPDGDVSTDGVLGSVANRKGKYLFFNAVTGAIEYAVNLVTTALSQSIIGQLLNPQTGSETLAGITPLNYFYSPGHVDRYATNAIPGTTSMTAAFQAAINQARKGGVDVVWGETGQYLLDGVLDCTFTGSAIQQGLRFRQIHHSSQDSPGGVFVKHSGSVVFDLTGCDAFTFDDIVVYTDAVTYPQYCFLTARQSGGYSLFPRIRNTKIVGRFSKALLYNYGAEDGIYIGNYWANYATDAGARLVVLTANNILSATSAYVTIATGAQSCIDHQFIGGQYLMVNASTTSDLFYLDVVENVRINSCWMSCHATAANARAYVYCDMTNGPSSFVHLNQVQGERGSFFPAYSVQFAGAAGTPTGWSMTNCYWQVGTASLGSAASIVLDNFHLKNVQEFAFKGLSIAGTLQSSSIDSANLGGTIQTTTKCSITSFKVNWTFTTPPTLSIFNDLLTGQITAYGGATIGALGSLLTTKLNGQAVFAAATTAAVSFGVTLGGSSYKVVLGQNASSALPPWVTAKATTGFTINFSAAFTGTVDWLCEQ